MIKPGYRLFLSFILMLSVPIWTNAQQIKATASLDSSKIVIGDQVRLILEINHPEMVTVDFPQVPDTIAEKIEVLDRSGIDTFQIDERNEKQIQSYLITSFDSGTYRIPPYWFKIDTNGKIDSIPTNGVTLDVFTIPVDTTKGPADIKMPYGAPVTLKEVIPYILGVILIGSILFLILYSIKRRKKNQPLFSLPKKPKEPAHVVALRELDRIKREKLWQQGKTKQYYSEVTEALRKYIEDRFDIPAMELTSDETLERFRFRRDLLDEEAFNYLRFILKLADLVKFAKYKPLPDDDNMTLVNAYFFVNNTKEEEKKIEPPGDKQSDGGEKEEKIVKDV